MKRTSLLKERNALCSTARLRGVHDGLFTGQIDAVDTTAATYRVTFDRSGLGTHTVPDYEVLVSTLTSCMLSGIILILQLLLAVLKKFFVHVLNKFKKCFPEQ